MTVISRTRIEWLRADPGPPTRSRPPPRRNQQAGNDIVLVATPFVTHAAPIRRGGARSHSHGTPMGWHAGQSTARSQSPAHPTVAVARSYTPMSEAARPRNASTVRRYSGTASRNESCPQGDSTSRKVTGTRQLCR